MKKSIRIAFGLLGFLLGISCYAEHISLDHYFDNKKKLDSLIVVNEAIGTLRQTFEYDKNDLVIKETFCDLDDDGTVAFGTTIIYKYNAQNQIAEKWTYEYFSNDWLSMEEYVYDANNNLIKIVNGSVKLAEYQYDEHNNLIEAIEGSNKTTYKYENDKKVEQIVYSLREENWVAFEKHTYQYNSDGKLAEEMCYVWNENDWHKKYLYIYSYNPDGQLVQKRHEEWDGHDVQTVKENLVCEHKATDNGVEITEKSNGELAVRSIYFFHRQK